MQRGLAVILDVVYNHFGPVGNYAGKFGPVPDGSNHRTPWGDAVNFEEGGSDEVRRFFCDNALMWMRDYHIDGLRLDAVHEYRGSVGDPLHGAAFGRGGGALVDAGAAARADRGERSERSADRDAARGGRLWHGRAVERRLPPCAVHVLHKGQEGMGYYDDFGTMENLAKSLKHVFVYDGDLLELPPSQARQAGGGALGASLSRLHPEPRPGGQSRDRRPA